MNLETLFSANIIIPIIVAFMGGLIAVTTAVIAKEHKISEFRQAWIDALRNDIAEFFSQCYLLSIERHKLKIIKSKKDKFDLEKNEVTKTNEKDTMRNLEIEGNPFDKKFVEKSLQIFILLSNIKKYSTLITLRLGNSNEYRDFIERLKFLELTQSKIETVFTTDLEILDEIEQLSLYVLKAEWERVKLGEKRFILFVSVGEFFGAVFIIAFYVLFFLAKFPELFPGIK